MEEEQERYLDDAKKVIKEQAYFMNKALQQANLRDALRYASVMLNELKTSLLTPRNYYTLFMQIFEEMQVLESNFRDEYRRGRKMNDLYEAVQKATNLIPRLYLLITVGSVYIQTHEVGAKKILHDLLEMIKSVQHPLRGLFVRYYFLKMCKERLPDKGSEYEGGEGGDINDAIEIIFINLTEMNKLWIRMGGGNKEKPKREKERIDLKVVVGENLLRLSSLDGVNLEVYQQTVLAKILDLVSNCKDPIAQQYLLDCTIQTFPDDYHLGTLQELLDVCTTKLDPKVDIRTIFIRLMDRLAEYAQDPDAQDRIQQILGDKDIYEMFKKNIDRMVDIATSQEFKNVLDLMVAFLKFTLKCYQDNSEYVNAILKSCVKICEKQHQADFDDDCLKNIVKFLTLPLDSMSLSILTMNEYPNLMRYLPFAKRRFVASKITQAVVTTAKKIEDVKIARQLIEFIKPLLVNVQDYQEIGEFEFNEEQVQVARCLHLIDNPDANIQWKILSMFIEQLKQGGLQRQVITYPSTFFCISKLLRKFKDAEVSQLQPFFDLMKEFVDTVAPKLKETALNLYLHLVILIGELDTQKSLDEFTYDIACKAMLIYTDELNDSESKARSLNLILGALNKTRGIGEENYDTLSSNATSYSSKILKKNDQCISVLKCAHLFYHDSLKDDNSANECLKKCIKIAGVCIKQSVKNVALYIHIFNKFLYFMNTEMQVDIAKVQDCLKEISTYLTQLEDDEESKQIKIYWQNTVQYIKYKKSQGVDGFDQLGI